jgi:hypothetical protein
MTRLTANQIDAMNTLNNYVGQTVEVLTSQYTNNVSPDFLQRAKGIVPSVAIRGLEAKGYIRIVNSYWRGATVEVLKPLA